MKKKDKNLKGKKVHKKDPRKGVSWSSRVIYFHEPLSATCLKEVEKKQMKWELLSR